MKIETKKKLVTLITGTCENIKIDNITSLEILKTKWDIHVENTCVVKTTTPMQFEPVKHGKFELKIQVVDGKTIDTHTLSGCSLHNMLDKSRTKFRIDFLNHNVDTDFEPDPLLIRNIEYQSEM